MKVLNYLIIILLIACSKQKALETSTSKLKTESTKSATKSSSVIAYERFERSYKEQGFKLISSFYQMEKNHIWAILESNKEQDNLPNKNTRQLYHFSDKLKLALSFDGGSISKWKIKHIILNEVLIMRLNYKTDSENVDKTLVIEEINGKYKLLENTNSYENALN